MVHRTGKRTARPWRALPAASAARSCRCAGTHGLGTRDRSWDGIAGKVGRSGQLSLGGSKEVAYAVFNAMSYDNQPGYTAIRGGAITLAGGRP